MGQYSARQRSKLLTQAPTWQISQRHAKLKKPVVKDDVLYGHMPADCQKGHISRHSKQVVAVGVTETGMGGLGGRENRPKIGRWWGVHSSENVLDIIEMYT